MRSALPAWAHSQVGHELTCRLFNVFVALDAQARSCGLYTEISPMFGEPARFGYNQSPMNE